MNSPATYRQASDKQTTYDAVVVGLGAMGSAAALHLASRGKRVLGLDRYRPPHRQGSSHGRTRAIRKAYFEHPSYVPLLARSYDLWRKLEADSGRDLLRLTGALMLGPPESTVVAGSREAARQHGLPHEVLDSRELARRFPPFAAGPEMIGLLEREGGVLRPEDCIEAQLELAAARGAELHFDEPVLSWEALGQDRGARIRTSRGTYETGVLILASGAWNGPLLAPLGLELPLRVVRKVMTWLQPEGGVEPFLPERFPVWVWDPGQGADVVYGFPAVDGPQGGVKLGIHSGGEACDPDTVQRTTGKEDVAELRRCLGDRLPALRPGLEAPLRSCVCLYTNTPDGHFILGPHPEAPQVLLAAGLSGHGFKFAGVVGEIMADLAAGGATRHEISLFSPRRFSSPA